jgi:hypothetical protein
METVAHQIHAARYRQIKAIVLHIAQGDFQQASKLAEAVRQELPTPAVLPEDIQAAFFLNALLKRLDPNTSDTGNLYLMPDEGQQIRMFNFMAEKFPMVRFAQDLVNAAHLAIIQSAGEHEVIILDIGIGSGQQLARLMQQIAEHNAALKQLTIIGIEPAPDSLTAAESMLSTVAHEYGLTLRFIGIPKALEALDESNWHQLETVLAERSGPFLVNAAFALHHTPPDVLRDQLFSWLYAQKPALVALIEPDADFLITNFLQRFDNAWQHYGLTFSAVDAIDATIEEKNLVKTGFFSREIQDVLSEDGQRIERFETGTMWLNRIRQAGFVPYTLSGVENRMPGCPFVTITQQPGQVVLNVEGSPLVSIVTGRLP